MIPTVRNEALFQAGERAAERAGERFRQEHIAMYKAALEKKKAAAGCSPPTDNVGESRLELPQ